MEKIKASDLVLKNFLKADVSEPLSKVVGKLSKSNKDNVIVFQNKNYAGMISKKILLRKKIDLSKVKVESVVEKFPTLEKNTSLEKIAELMYHSDARMLPVIDNSFVIGFVDAISVIKQLKKFSEFKKLTAKDLASKNLQTVDSKTSISKVIALMREQNIGRLPVVNGSGNLIGLVSYYDILKYYLYPKTREGGFRDVGSIFSKVHTHGFEPEKIAIRNAPIENIMSRAQVCEEDTPLPSLINLLEKSPDKSVVLVKEEKPIGIVSQRNLLKCFSDVKEAVRKIHVINLPLLDEIDLAKVNSLIVDSYDKLQTRVNNEIILFVHFKSSHKGGIRKQHEVLLRLKVAGTLIVSKETDWNLITALQKAFSNLERETAKAITQR